MLCRVFTHTHPPLSRLESNTMLFIPHLYVRPPARVLGVAGGDDHARLSHTAHQAVVAGRTHRPISMPSLQPCIDHVHFFLVQDHLLMSHPVSLALCTRVITARCLQLCYAVQTLVLAVHEMILGKVQRAVASSGGGCDGHLADSDTATLAQFPLVSPAHAHVVLMLIQGGRVGHTHGAALAPGTILLPSCNVGH